MAKILVCDPIHEDGVKMLQDAGFQVDLETDISPEKLLTTIPEYDAMVIRSDSSGRVTLKPETVIILESVHPRTPRLVKLKSLKPH